MNSAREKILKYTAAFSISFTIYLILIFFNTVISDKYPAFYITFFSQEDSPGQVLTIVFSLFCFYESIQNYFKEKRKTDLALAIWFLLTAYEEFSLRSSLLSSNLQGELTLHNLPYFQNNIAIEFVYYLTPLFLYIWKKRSLSPLMLGLVSLFSFMLLYITPNVFDSVTTKLYAEQKEFLISLILLVLFCNKSQVYKSIVVSFVFTLYFYFNLIETDISWRINKVIKFANYRSIKNKSVHDYYLYGKKLDLYNDEILLMSVLKLLSLKGGEIKVSNEELIKDINTLTQISSNHLIFNWLAYSISSYLKETSYQEEIKKNIQNSRARSCIEETIIKMFTSSYDSTCKSLFVNINQEYNFKDFLQKNQPQIKRRNLNLADYTNLNKFIHAYLKEKNKI